MRESIFETILGIVVVAIAGAFLYFSLNTTSQSTAAGSYDLTARFNSVSGVERGTEVKIAGVKVGVVTDVELDPERFDALVRMTMNDDVVLTDDTDARISTDGLLGGSFISVEPGGGFDTIPTDGSGEIIFTRGSVDLLTLFASFAQQGDSDE